MVQWSPESSASFWPFVLPLCFLIKCAEDFWFAATGESAAPDCFPGPQRKDVPELRCLLLCGIELSAGFDSFQQCLTRTRLAPKGSLTARQFSLAQSPRRHLAVSGTAQGRTGFVLPGRCPNLIPPSTAGSFSPACEGIKSSATGSGEDFLGPSCLIPDTLLIHT